MQHISASKQTIIKTLQILGFTLLFLTMVVLAGFVGLNALDITASTEGTEIELNIKQFESLCYTDCKFDQR